jgi:hypothetical protein
MNGHGIPAAAVSGETVALAQTLERPPRARAIGEAGRRAARLWSCPAIAAVPVSLVLGATLSCNALLVFTVLQSRAGGEASIALVSQLARLRISETYFALAELASRDLIGQPSVATEAQAIDEVG